MMDSNTFSNTVEVCFSPELYDHKLTKSGFITVVVDILRATTSICTGLECGIREIIPVSGLDEAKQYKEKGFLLAAERNGEVLEFADMGNSASDFQQKDLKGKTVVFSTTNGTQTINQARDAEEVVIGSFINLNAVAEWLKEKNKNVVIFCAAWKSLFNLEDSIFAGALAEILLKDKQFETVCDSTLAAIDLWQIAKTDLKGYLSKSSHRNRLKHLVSDADFEFTVTLDSSEVVPVLKDDALVASR